MRVVYISSSAVPSRTANSIQVMKMCQALAQKGYEVQLLAPKWRTQMDFRETDLWHHYGIKTPFPIRWLPWPYGRYGSHLYAMLAVIYALFLRSSVVFTRHLPAAAIARFFRLPTVCELHQLPEGQATSLYIRCFLHYRGLRKVVVISHALKRDLIDTYPDLIEEDDIVVAHDGVDIERFKDVPDVSKARQKLGLPPDHFTAGYVGHFYPGKGIELVVNLARGFPRISFLIIGGEPNAVSTLKQQLKQAKIPNVFLYGFISNAELPIHLAACDALLLPVQRIVEGSSGSNIARWTSPMKLFEYMACGRLIIASDLPVLREVLNEENSLLCDPDDLNDWHQGLNKAMKDIVWRQALGQQARKDANRYAWTQRVDLCLQPVLQNLPNLDV